MLDVDPHDCQEGAIPLCDLKERLAAEYTNLHINLMKYGRDLTSVLGEVQEEYRHRLNGWAFTFSPLWELEQSDNVNLDKGVFQYHYYHEDTTMVIVYPYTSQGNVLSLQQQQQKHLATVHKQQLNQLTMEMNNLYEVSEGRVL
jgi:hypothetical protein